jgi:F0F1-type ATP synthase membrane subunit c/vacuolar-type H+-ATPase subunit K
MPYQYGNQANPNAHYNGTALEILEELDEVTAFVAGLGTGGTLMGNGRRLKETFGDAVKIVAAEPMQGEPVQGLRSLDDGFIPPIIDISLLDRKIFVTNRDAIVLDAQAARRGGRVRGRLQRRDRQHRRAHRGRAGRGQRRVRGRRRRLEVPVERHLHAAGRRDREPRLDRVVVGARSTRGKVGGRA